MELYPVVTVGKGRAHRNKTILSKDETLHEIQKLIKENGYVYIIDLDGYHNNEPNFELYKKLKGNFWVDAAPKYAEDVMDIVVNGANRLTLWPIEDSLLASIRHMCENELFLRGNDPHHTVKTVRTHGFNGLVLDDNQTGSWDVETWKLSFQKETIQKVT